MYKQLLLSIYNEAIDNKSHVAKLREEILDNIEIISNKCFNQKAVFTVLVTLSIYKIKHKKQDIRLHRTEFKNGFSGRSFDAKHITPH